MISSKFTTTKTQIPPKWPTSHWLFETYEFGWAPISRQSKQLSVLVGPPLRSRGFSEGDGNMSQKMSEGNSEVWNWWLTVAITMVLCRWMVAKLLLIAMRLIQIVCVWSGLWGKHDKPPEVLKSCPTWHIGQIRPLFSGSCNQPAMLSQVQLDFLKP